MKQTAAQLRAHAKYDALNAVKVNFKFNRKTDADIIDKLDRVDGKQSYIKRLIREDIAREKEGDRDA